MTDQLIDVNVYLERWPSRRLPQDEAPRLVRALRAAGVTHAWAGSFDALLHKDLSSVNQRLVATCQRFGAGLLNPVGAVNVNLPDWQGDLRACHTRHRMRMIRIHPNYHGYQLDSPAMGELMAVAQRQRLIVQIAVRMEDPRTQHPLLRVADVSVEPLADLSKDYARVPVILTNALRTITPDIAHQLASAGNIYFDIAMLEGVGGVATWLRTLPLERLLFGSYCPFFYVESSQLKLKESPLARFQYEAIAHGNAQSIGLDR